jgi:hypothetical protein
MKKSLSKLTGTLATRTRMIQLGMLGMCIAMWIIWWRK